MDSSSQKPRQVVLKAESVVTTRIREPLRTGSDVLLRIGGAICLVGFVKVVLLWLPPHFGTPAWRFGVVSDTMAALPVAAAGAALLSYGLIRSPERDGSRVRALATAFAVIAAAFPIFGLIYLSALPAVFGSAPEVAVAPLRRAVLETLVGLVVACAACVTVAKSLWRGVNVKRRRGEALDMASWEGDEATDN